MQKFLFFISIVSLSSIVQAFEDDNIPYIQYQEVLTIDMGKLMGTWRCLECFWLNSRDQSDCDRCGYHNKEIEEEIKRRKEQNLKETLKEIFLMLKNNDEAVDLFNGRIYINPERLVYKAGKYYIQDDNMNYVLIDQISEDINGYYIYVNESEKIMKEKRFLIDFFYNDLDLELILCRGFSFGGDFSVKKDKKSSSIKAGAKVESYTENDTGINHSIEAKGRISYEEKNQQFQDPIKESRIDGKIDYSITTDKNNSYSIGVGGGKTYSSDCPSDSSGYVQIGVDY